MNSDESAEKAFELVGRRNRSPDDACVDQGKNVVLKSSFGHCPFASRMVSQQ